MEKKRPYHKWQDYERDIVRNRYNGTGVSVRVIAGIIGVTEQAVWGQVHCLGLAGPPMGKPWSGEERVTLSELIYQYNPKKVAEIMHRSLSSVVAEARRLKLSRRIRDGWFIMREVCEILGVDHKWLRKRINTGALKAHWHYDNTPPSSGGGCWHINTEDLKNYLVKYSRELTGRNVDLFLLVDILVGINGS